MLSLTADTPLRTLHDIAASDYHAGVPRLMFLYGHAGNQALPEPACRGLRARLGFIAADVVRNDLACPECIVGTSEARNGLHAGDVETSAILAAAFPRVRTDLVMKFDSAHQRWQQANPCLGLGVAGMRPG